MFKLKLHALEHHEPETFDAKDEKQFRALVLWLEEQKIRHYKIEDREELRKTNSDKWRETLYQYIRDLICPIKSQLNVEIIEWLLSYAIRLEYEDNLDKFSKLKSGETTTANQPKVVYANPLDNMDFESEAFKTGVSNLAKLLKITPHPNHLITLRAISKLIKTRFSVEALQNPDSVIPKGTPFPYQTVDEGFDIGDVAVNNATKMLRLLFLHDLRGLQTHINECIVAVQNLTANPKTDTSLGKVGR